MLVETRCGRLFVEEHGSDLEGTPVVLWPSLLTDGGMWRAQIEALEGRARVLVIDPPGHGRSSVVTAPYTMDDCVDAALAVLDAAKIARCRWAGLSWGGMVGMRLAFRAPERVEKLALLDTNADAETREKLPKYRLLTLLARAFGPAPFILDRTVPIYFSASSRAERPEIVQRFRQHVAGMDKGSLLAALDAVMFTRRDVRPELHRITAKTLVMVGTEDVATPEARSVDISSRIASARLVRIPRAGHLSAWEQPGAVNASLIPFLLD